MRDGAGGEAAGGCGVRWQGVRLLTRAVVWGDAGWRRRRGSGWARRSVAACPLTLRARFCEGLMTGELRMILWLAITDERGYAGMDAGVASLEACSTGGVGG